VRSALEQRTPDNSLAGHNPAPLNQQVVAAGRSTQMVAQFAHELERVDGHFIGSLATAELGNGVVRLIKEIQPQSVAVGEAEMLDFGPMVKALERSGIELLQFHSGNGHDRRDLRERLAHCDVAIVEAQYAIAATGTLVVIANPGRPSSLTLLPPCNIILVDALRILPDIAAVIAALGPRVVQQHRVVFITGPSRTADIEKMIVLGVHGPRNLYAAAVWGSGARPSA
jgi:L-lactate dehydrogenase complex protein LldG